MVSEKGTEKREMASFPYEDIVDLPCPVSKRHKPMDPVTRAAQFSPFAALSGFDDVIREEERLTTPRPEIGDGEKELLDQKLGVLSECQSAHPAVTVTYFAPDLKKEGGTLITFTGTLRSVNVPEGNLTFTDGRIVPLADLTDLNGSLFSHLDDAHFFFIP